ncbi:MAG: glycoside hydrolase family 3 N-terminal domain-containing protein [Humidesulfovibrio sp.]|uniref:glycoside hydrolase family 3 protein n=1 Tax=Humidesulfovibrio sp. TaxID=2910988 RepID=UPI002732C709|nr:glycoside hydrolase family 3 N-terminal domain-containing protein [Humidesulfovibrio sp.]MDP2846677.1 glycoside hydrolase family 3 N-terminal domain-containing protein [Humidesulfovibrio sp.]
MRRSLRTPALLALTLLTLLQGCALTRPEPPSAELKRQAGQMLLVGFRGAEPADESGKPLPILRQVPALNLGGVILFDRDAALGLPGRNVKSPEQVRRLTSALSLAAQDASLLPLFIAVDQEGGRVQRLKSANGFPDSPAAADLCPGDENKADPRPALAAGEATGRMLHQAGFNLNFAPVCDVNVNPDNPVIGKISRSFSADPQRAATCARAFALGLQGQGVLTSAKHFPGHGSSTSDSHLGFTDVSATWTEAELIPFAELIRTGQADMIMTAHVFNDRLDAKHPATLSRPVITGLLRRKLGFDGVVVTDDLQMRAIGSRYGMKEAIGLAVNAGADLLLIGNNLAYDEDIAPKALDALMELVAEGVVPAERIRESVARVAALKAKSLSTRPH